MKHELVAVKGALNGKVQKVIIKTDLEVKSSVLKMIGNTKKLRGTNLVYEVYSDDDKLVIELGSGYLSNIADFDEARARKRAGSILRELGMSMDLRTLAQRQVGTWLGTTSKGAEVLNNPTDGGKKLAAVYQKKCESMFELQQKMLNAGEVVGTTKEKA